MRLRELAYYRYVRFHESLLSANARFRSINRFLVPILEFSEKCSIRRCLRTVLHVYVRRVSLYIKEVLLAYIVVSLHPISIISIKITGDETEWPLNE